MTVQTARSGEKRVFQALLSSLVQAVPADYCICAVPPCCQTASSHTAACLRLPLLRKPRPMCQGPSRGGRSREPGAGTVLGAAACPGRGGRGRCCRLPRLRFQGSPGKGQSRPCRSLAGFGVSDGGAGPSLSGGCPRPSSAVGWGGHGAAGGPPPFPQTSHTGPGMGQQGAESCGFGCRNGAVTLVPEMREDGMHRAKCNTGDDRGWGER